MQFISHHKHAVNISSAETALSVAAGIVLILQGFRRRSAVLALCGGELLRRGITGHSHVFEAFGIRTAPPGQGAATTSVPYELGIRVDRSITIHQPRSSVFAFFRKLSNLPLFMEHVRSVTETEGGRSHWVVNGPAGRTVEWDAMVVNESPNEMLAWRTLPGSTVDHAGSVWFRDAPGGRGTEVKVALQYNPPGGAVGALFSRFWGEEPTQQIAVDLHRLKQVLETGEAITTSGQSQGGQEQKRPEKRTFEEWEVQQASEASFPASDAPSYTR